MGRIKTTFIKRKSRELLKTHGEKFCTDFVKNKEVTNSYTSVGSKKMRNVVAGYMTRLKQQED